MQIRFISTLTREDEDRLAESLFEMAKGLLATLPIGFMLRIDTTSGASFQDSRVDSDPQKSAPGSALGLRSGDFSRGNIHISRS
jgi:hypothetical protein